MFTVHCPVAGAEVLLGPSTILSMHNSSEGIVSYFRCRCGATGIMVSGRMSLQDRTWHPADGAEPSLDALVAATAGAGALAGCA